MVGINTIYIAKALNPRNGQNLSSDPKPRCSRKAEQERIREKKNPDTAAVIGHINYTQ